MRLKEHLCFPTKPGLHMRNTKWRRPLYMQVGLGSRSHSSASLLPLHWPFWKGREIWMTYVLSSHTHLLYMKPKQMCNHQSFLLPQPPFLIRKQNMNYISRCYGPSCFQKGNFPSLRQSLQGICSLIRYLTSRDHLNIIFWSLVWVFICTPDIEHN